MAYYSFGSRIARWWNPSEKLTMTTDEFVEFVKQGKNLDDVLNKQVVLVGTPKSDYSSVHPFVALDGLVKVKIESMADGGPSPESLPTSQLQLSGVVDTVYPVLVGDDLIGIIVYLVDVELGGKK